MDKFIMILMYVCVPYQVEMVMISLCCRVEWRPWPIRSASRRVGYRCGSTVSKFNFHRTEWQRACRVYSRAHHTHTSSHYSITTLPLEHTSQSQQTCEIFSSFLVLNRLRYSFKLALCFFSVSQLRY